VSHAKPIWYPTGKRVVNSHDCNVYVQVDVHKQGFTPDNALSLVSAYDIVVDATDNAPTRYLISDACVAARRPLVSGAALGTDGQLTVYCHGDDGTPWIRILKTSLLLASHSAAALGG
jgi:molybdopterin/thiamine biosynthesis adenylyltransferase